MIAGMGRMILRRALVAVPTLWVLVTLAFVLVRLAPGGPFDADRALPPAVEASMEARYGLDQPLLTQYGRYLEGLVRGDFGPSFHYRDYTVTELIGQGFPVSALIGGLSMLAALLVGGAAGIAAAMNYRRGTDHALMGVAMAGISIPNFVIAPLLVLLVAIHAGWLPAGGWNGGAPAHLVLPVIALALPQVAYVARIVRAGLLETMQRDFILAARARGLPRWRIILFHAMRPALRPLVSYFGPAVAAVLTGSVVIEEIFGLPGLGRFFVQGALNRDYTLVMGVVVFYGALIIAVNLLVDIAYGWIDPEERRHA